MEELPSQIRSFGEAGVSFDEFFMNVTNGTPATSDAMKQAFDALRREGAIEIRDETGLEKRPSIQKNSDIITAKRHLFFLPNEDLDVGE